MKMFLLIVEFSSAFFLVIAILLHSAKGEGLAGIGGQSRMFNSQKGLESGLTKITAVLAAIFMISGGLFGVFF